MTTPNPQPAEQPFRGKTVVFDFDGVVHSYESGWTGEVPTDGPEPGAREVMQWALDAGFTVVVQSTRASTAEGLDGIIAWLDRCGFPRPTMITDRKVPAIAYVDDRAVSHRPGTDDWEQVQFEILRLARGTR